MPQILYDHQIFSQQTHGGISRYFAELTQGISRLPGCTVDFNFCFTNNEHLLEGQMRQRFRREDSRASIQNPWLQRWERRARLQGIRWRLDLRRRIKRFGSRFDIFHPTYYDPYFLDLTGDRPFVLTVYDMIHEKFPNRFPPNDPVREWKRLLAHKADSVIAISANTKKDLVSFTNVPAEKVRVIYLASSIEKAPRRPPPPGLPEKYLLFLGKREGYKNFNLFAAAAGAVLERFKDLSLVCAGGGPLQSTEMRPFEQSGTAARVHHRHVSEAELPPLYTNAVAFVYPSLYEGFGLPVLEAFACDCPVAASCTGSIPEIAGDAVMYFEPDDPKSIFEAISRLVDSPSLRDTLRQKGANRNSQFSWRKTITETTTLYAETLENRRSR